MMDKETRKVYMREWRAKNADHIREYNKKYVRDVEKTRGIWNKFYQNNRERRLLTYKQYYNENKEAFFERSRKIYREKSKLPVYRIHRNIRYQIWRMLKSQKGHGKWESYVGYSLKELMNHLESKFDEHMSWENYGSYWHIDHIKPVSLFSFKSLEDDSIRECWALSNLQPLEAIENIRKGNRYKEV